MGPRMRILARLLVATFCSLMLFIAGVLSTFKINLLIHEVEEFNHNEPAKFGILMEGIFIGFLLAVCGIPLAGFLCNRIRWLRIPN
jgi:hypothetical protein